MFPRIVMIENLLPYDDSLEIASLQDMWQQVVVPKGKFMMDHRAIWLSNDIEGVTPTMITETGQTSDGVLIHDQYPDLPTGTDMTIFLGIKFKPLLPNPDCELDQQLEAIGDTPVTVSIMLETYTTCKYEWNGALNPAHDTLFEVLKGHEHSMTIYIINDIYLDRVETEGVLPDRLMDVFDTLQLWIHSSLPQYMRSARGLNHYMNTHFTSPPYGLIIEGDGIMVRHQRERNGGTKTTNQESITIA